MLINVENFKDFLKKATLNYYIDSVQVNYWKEGDVLKSSMVSKCSDVATILNIPNNIFKEANQDIELNFCAPKNDLKPFLDLIDSDEVKFKLHEKKIVLNMGNMMM